MRQRRVGRWIGLGSLAAGLALAALACGETAVVTGDGQPFPGQDGATGDASAGDANANGDAVVNGDAKGNADANGDPDAQTMACDDCKPDFCGCGQCTEAQVVCTKTPRACPIACATACDLSLYKCACAADRCVHVAPTSKVIGCYATPDCPPGQCCELGTGLAAGTCRAGNDCVAK